MQEIRANPFGRKNKTYANNEREAQAKYNAFFRNLLCTYAITEAQVLLKLTL